MMITRENFVQICTQSILKTRKSIAIINQVSGYKRYHREIKENGYFERVRKIIGNNEWQKGYSLFYNRDLIEYAGLGNCHELADFLCAEVLQSLQVAGAEAQAGIVCSRECDHVFVHVKIYLKNEAEFSVWEIDAWDPRIIDISMRPDGSIKNEEVLNYGSTPALYYSLTTRELEGSRNKNCFFKISKPQEGIPLREATPEREITKKHKKIYEDYTLAEAYESGKLDEDGKIHYLQQVSSWQLGV
jgi:hypothetical protein